MTAKGVCVFLSALCMFFWVPFWLYCCTFMLLFMLQCYVIFRLLRAFTLLTFPFLLVCFSSSLSYLFFHLRPFNSTMTHTNELLPLHRFALISIILSSPRSPSPPPYPAHPPPFPPPLPTSPTQSSETSSLQ